MSVNEIVLILLFSPIISALFMSLFSQKKKNIPAILISSFLILISFLSSIYLLFISNSSLTVDLFKWVSIGHLDIEFAFLVDHISLIMSSTVTLVSFIVFIYSIYYMNDDKSINRFFSYLGGFVFSMLILVLSDNFLGLFIGWEGVGLCSWLLIGFWYSKGSANSAANEAFITNRIADVFMLSAIFLIYNTFGTLKYTTVFNSINSVDETYLTIIAIFLFIGAMGKSAQFPFHNWLANAMEGPTPVSALIHAATMVTAGVYLLIRCHKLYEVLPNVGFMIAILGTFVAIFAASMALVHKDLKRIIAYSTLSQLGYMFAVVGLGGYIFALFHLVMHAFFKALLFLCAGNVMHSMKDELNIFKMGGLNRYMKVTSIFMIIGSLALCGLYPFAGYFSKDKILEVALASGHNYIYTILLLGAGFTAFYSFRLLMLVFFTKKRHNIEDIHEAPSYVFIFLSILAILSIVAGFSREIYIEYVGNLLPILHLEMSNYKEIIMVLSITAVVILSSIFAILAYKKEIFTNKLKGNFIYNLLLNEYYIPLFYKKIVINFYYMICHIANIIDNIISGIIHFKIKVAFKLGRVGKYIEGGDISTMIKVFISGFTIMILYIYFYF